MSYDTWKCTPPDDFDPMADYVHVDDLKTFYDGEKDARKMLHALYITGDKEDFESALQDLLTLWALDVPETEIMI